MSEPKKGDPVSAVVTGIYVSAGTGPNHSVAIETSPGTFTFVPGDSTITVVKENKS